MLRARDLALSYIKVWDQLHSLAGQAPHHLKLAAYERELIGLVKAVRHWRPYLWGRVFTVCTDHYSLKYLLDQRLSTIPQHTWVSKLFGYDFAVEFRSGHQNAAADALSQRQDQPIALGSATPSAVMAISSPSFAFFDALCTELSTNLSCQSIREQIVAGTASPAWSVVDDLLLHEGRVFVPVDSLLWPQLLEEAHGSGHEGV